MTTRPPALSGKQRRYLRSLAHALKPVVQIGHAGLTDSVVTAIETALESHELIKIKLPRDAEPSFDDLVPEIERRTLACVAQVIGRTLVVYRARAKDPRISLPRPSEAPPAGGPELAGTVAAGEPDQE